MDRIDALGKRPERLRSFAGDILSEELDDTLQALVEEASRKTHSPIALVSLVLENMQFCRAHCGLPEDLAATRATDRDVSFCQFVVRDRCVFEVSDAPNDLRIPQELVKRYGIGSYLGAPVSVGEEVLGSLCAIDVKPHTFSDDERQALVRIAKDVSARLAVLAGARRKPRGELLEHAVAPLFGGLRNLLGALAGNSAMAAVAATELGPLIRLAEYSGRKGQALAAGVLLNATRALDDLREALQDIAGIVPGLQRAVAALEHASVGKPTDISIHDVVEAANELAYHATKVAGGVAWDPLPPGVRIRERRPVAVALVSACLSGLANTLRAKASLAGIRGRFVLDAGNTYICLSSSQLTAAEISEVSTAISPLLSGEQGAAVGAAARELQIAFVASDLTLSDPGKS